MLAPTAELELMAKKPPQTPPASEPDLPSSETVRISGDLMEMLREICFHSRDERGRRFKMTQYLDGLIRPLVLREYAAFQKRQEGEGD